ncbi:hypothetical protein CANARDRAFT_25034 [[Candida] arabinofermentans NRRL YB-2248]|uniref:Uncharacterized protein n=1 Tax=[Candida] arabinofermentans NRRL YB-2248 TaxID=983967 RepID=A0A1E4SVD0_9ASCO|nr:hypothetical protein CANARDRAFT_25034 [[Candida] arabinofermentans NRRL YB-2248]
MKYALTLMSAASLATTAFAAYVPTQPWSTLTPTGTLTATSDVAGKTFGIVVQTLDAGYKKVKRDDALVTQIGDGQIQYPTTTSYETAMDTPTAVYVNTQPLVTQIGDGQIQFPTGDNTQYEAPSTSYTPCTTTYYYNTFVTQINDGQIQATNLPQPSTDNEELSELQEEYDEVYEVGVPDFSNTLTTSNYNFLSHIC